MAVKETTNAGLSSFVQKALKFVTGGASEVTGDTSSNYKVSDSTIENVKNVTNASSDIARYQQRKIVTADLNSQIKTRLNGVRDILDSRACFLKPSYFLQSATPYVSAKLLLVGGNDGGDLTFDFLPPSEAGKSQNIVKTFEYDVNTSGIRLTVSDADQDLIEYFAFLFATLALTNPPILEVTYGWAHPKESELIQGNYIENPTDPVATSKFDAYVYFKRTLFCNVNDFESTYTPEGVLELTLVGNMSGNFPAPYQHFLPYDILGQKPAVSLQTIQTLYHFAHYFNTRTATLSYDHVKYVAEFFYYFKQVEDKDQVAKVTYQTFKFFANDKIMKIPSFSEGVQSKYFKRLKGEIESWKKQKRKKIPLVEVIIKKTTKDDTPLNIKEVSKIFSSSMMNSVESLRNDLKGVGAYNDALRKYITTLTPSLTNALIHPYDVIKYVQQCFLEQGSIYNFVEEKNIFVITGFPDNSIGGYPKKTALKYDKNTEKYFVKSGDIVLNNTSSWDQTFSMLANKCHVWVNKTDYTAIKKTTDISSEILKTDSLSASKNLTPVSMTGNCFVVKKKDALFNMNTLKMIVQARQVDSQIVTKSKTEETTAEASLTGVNGIEKAIKAINALDDDAWVAIVSYDIIPGMNNLFDPINGKNQIIQTYSYRGGGTLAFTDKEGKNLKQYNPGYPNVWSINFPDVISFTPKFKLKNQIDNLNLVMKQDVEYYDRAIADAEAKKAEIEAEEKASKKKSKSESTISKLEELDDSIDKLKNQQELYQQYHGKMPYKSPTILNGDNSPLDISTSAKVENRRKTMQEFRKQAILTSANIEVDMEVLGDPIFNIHTNGKYVFIKYYTQLGDLSFFTGIYTIMSTKQTISNGSFVTTFSLIKDCTAGSTDFTSQLYTAITENDNGSA